MGIFFNKRKKQDNSVSLSETRVTIEDSDLLPVEVRFNNILSGKIDSLSIREILEYYCSENYSGLREDYDYCWSNFSAPLEMNFTDLVEILTDLDRYSIFNMKANVLNYIVSECYYRVTEPAKDVISSFPEMPPSKMTQEFGDFEEVISALKAIGYDPDTGDVMRSVVEPIDNRPKGFDASTIRLGTIGLNDYVEVAEILGNQRGTYNLSIADIAIWNCSALYAKQNLSKEEYRAFVNVYDGFYENKSMMRVDLAMYQALHRKIMAEFDKYFPYTLIYFDSGRDMTSSKEQMFRGWYKNGIRGDEAINRFYGTV